jgi:hypothetical protein
MQNDLWPDIDYFHFGTAAAQARLQALELVERHGWYSLYQRRSDGSYWRLDQEDKYQGSYIVRISIPETWRTFDATHLEKQLLLAQRGGLAAERCLVAGCASTAIRKSAFCLDHTYERGVRR